MREVGQPDHHMQAWRQELQRRGFQERWDRYRTSAAEEPDYEWTARLRAEVDCVSPNDYIHSDEDAKPQQEFARLWAKIRPNAGPMPPTLSRSADEVLEIIQRLLALALTLSAKGIEFDDTREFAALLGTPRGRRTRKAAAERLAKRLSGKGPELHTGRGPKPKPLRTREALGLTALGRILNTERSAEEIDADVGTEHNIGVRQVERLRTKKSRSQRS